MLWVRGADCSRNSVAKVVAQSGNGIMMIISLINSSGKSYVGPRRGGQPAGVDASCKQTNNLSPFSSKVVSDLRYSMQNILSTLRHTVDT